MKMTLEVFKSFAVLCLLSVFQKSAGTSASQLSEGHIHAAVEILHFKNPSGTSFLQYSTRSTRKCCDLSKSSNCDARDTCDVRFSVCIGSVTGQSLEDCVGILLNSTEVLKDTNSAWEATNIKFPVFNLTTWNSEEKITVYMIDDDTPGNNNATLAGDLIDIFTGDLKMQVDTDFWTSQQHLVTLTKCASVTIGIRVFCESNYYGENCSQYMKPDMFHHTDIVNRSIKHILDCKSNGSSVINIFTSDPYSYTIPSLKKRLVLFLVDKVCLMAANTVNVKIDNVRYEREILRVAFSGDCQKPITDLEVHHALNYMRSSEILQYFGNKVERLDETIKIKKGRLNIVYRLLDVFRVDSTGKTLLCRVNECNATIHIDYRNQSVTTWKVSLERGLNYCFRGLENTKQNNTEHIISEYPAVVSEPLEITIETDTRNGVKNPAAKFRIPVLNYTRTSVTGNSYRHLSPAEITRTDKIKGLGLTIGLFVWCSTGYTGKRCEESCETGQPDCNYDKCSPPGKHNYDHNIHCDHGHCNETTKLCECEPGYIGPMCRTQIDYCKLGLSDSPCIHGKCASNVHNITCECNKNYTGRLCETRIQEQTNFRRSERDTFNSGIVMTDLPSSKSMNEHKCLNFNSCGNGTSVNYKNNITCSCDIGFSGNQCKHVDYCASNPCFHGGFCVNTNNRFTCKCKDGFHGKKCDKIYKCSESLCQNNSTCINLTLSRNHTCLCQKGYTGRSCELKNHCESQSCENGTECHNHSNAEYTCKNRLFAKLTLPAHRPSFIDDDNVTDNMEKILGNITRNCSNIKILFDVIDSVNGSSTLYVAVLCDGTLLSSELIAKQFEYYPTDEIVEILHFIPLDKKNKAHTDGTMSDKMWIEEYWIILTGVATGVVAAGIGIVKALHIVYGKGKRQTHETRIGNNSTNYNEYVSFRHAFASDKANTLDTVKLEVSRKNLNFSKMGPAHVNPNHRRNSVHPEKYPGYPNATYYLSPQTEKQDRRAHSMADSIAESSVPRQTRSLDIINTDEWNDPQYGARQASFSTNDKKDFRKSYIDSKMTFLTRNPIYGLSKDQWQDT
ncbi:uncharacterized protein LOC123553974 [Mercenaria mercenaria]|uniref:uncharacterized protein LOC123553974 n=1 Tax=Mercenaria mercenaria TaxID=6596 RepID=UPI00234F26AB|nr:uncharacterized protein LOC123553974 [Mercenaria mercenaria]